MKVIAMEIDKNDYDRIAEMIHSDSSPVGMDAVYVHAKRRPDIKRRIREEFNGRNRRELCAKYGISRAWFYRLLGER